MTGAQILFWLAVIGGVAGAAMWAQRRVMRPELPRPGEDVAESPAITP